MTRREFLLVRFGRATAQTRVPWERLYMRMVDAPPVREPRAGDLFHVRDGSWVVSDDLRMNLEAATAAAVNGQEIGKRGFDGE